MIICRRFCMFLMLCGVLAGGCALFNDNTPNKSSTTGLISTPPAYYSTAKARYLGTRYKGNLDRLIERIVRDPKTTTLQFANNISSVGGIGFFTHSATKSPDERYLEVILVTSETFEIKGAQSEKVGRLFSLYGPALLGILTNDSEIFQDKELSGYGLNLAWRNVTAAQTGNRVSMERAILYFSKERVRGFLRQEFNQNEFLSDAVIFAVEENGPLQLVSYKPQEVRADFRPAIREDDLASRDDSVKPTAVGAQKPIGKDANQKSAQKSGPAKDVSTTTKEAVSPPTAKLETTDLKPDIKTPVGAEQKAAEASAKSAATPVVPPTQAKPSVPPPAEPSVVAKQDAGVATINPKPEAATKPESRLEPTPEPAPTAKHETMNLKPEMKTSVVAEQKAPEVIAKPAPTPVVPPTKAEPAIVAKQGVGAAVVNPRPEATTKSESRPEPTLESPPTPKLEASNSKPERKMPVVAEQKAAEVIAKSAATPPTKAKPSVPPPAEPSIVSKQDAGATTMNSKADGITKPEAGLEPTPEPAPTAKLETVDLKPEIKTPVVAEQKAPDVIAKSVATPIVPPTKAKPSVPLPAEPAVVAKQSVGTTLVNPKPEVTTNPASRPEPTPEPALTAKHETMNLKPETKTPVVAEQNVGDAIAKSVPTPVVLPTKAKPSVLPLAEPAVVAKQGVGTAAVNPKPEVTTKPASRPEPTLESPPTAKLEASNSKPERKMPVVAEQKAAEVIAKSAATPPTKAKPSVPPPAEPSVVSKQGVGAAVVNPKPEAATKPESRLEPMPELPPTAKLETTDLKPEIKTPVVAEQKAPEVIAKPAVTPPTKAKPSVPPPAEPAVVAKQGVGVAVVHPKPEAMTKPESRPEPKPIPPVVAAVKKPMAETKTDNETPIVATPPIVPKAIVEPQKVPTVVEAKPREAIAPAAPIVRPMPAAPLPEVKPAVVRAPTPVKIESLPDPIAPPAEARPAETKVAIQEVKIPVAPLPPPVVIAVEPVNKVTPPPAASVKPEPPAPAAKSGESAVASPAGQPAGTRAASEQIALLTNKPVESRPENKPVIRSTPKALEGFIVQLAFSDKEKALRWAESMERRGYAVSVTEAGAEGRLRVRLGNFAQRDDAERQLRSFKQDGLNGIIINLPQGFQPEARSSMP